MENACSFNYIGLLTGFAAFVCIGVFHPVVVKVEYHFGRPAWKWFFISGLLFAAASLFMVSQTMSIFAGTLGFALLWTSHEITEQHKRVLLGRAKRNPNRNYQYAMFFVPVSFMSLNFSGLAIGLATFLSMALGRWSVIKAEYYFTKKIWVAYLVSGLALTLFSLILESYVWSVVAGVAAFVLFWGIIEVFEQEKRVEKGWFPKRR